MLSEQEKRSSSRIQLSRQAKLDFTTQSYDKCPIQDLSLTGMFVQGDFLQNDGDDCIVILDQEGKHSFLQLKAAARVIRKDGEGMAIAFTSMPVESLMLLQMILQCEDGAGSSGREVKSFETLPFAVQDDLFE